MQQHQIYIPQFLDPQTLPTPHSSNRSTRPTRWIANHPRADRTRRSRAHDPVGCRGLETGRNRHLDVWVWTISGAVWNICLEPLFDAVYPDTPPELTHNVESKSPSQPSCSSPSSSSICGAQAIACAENVKKCTLVRQTVGARRTREITSYEARISQTNVAFSNPNSSGQILVVRKISSLGTSDGGVNQTELFSPMESSHRRKSNRGIPSSQIRFERFFSSQPRDGTPQLETKGTPCSMASRTPSPTSWQHGEVEPSSNPAWITGTLEPNHQDLPSDPLRSQWVGHLYRSSVLLVTVLLKFGLVS